MQPKTRLIITEPLVFHQDKDHLVREIARLIREATPEQLRELARFMDMEDEECSAALRRLSKTRS